MTQWHGGKGSGRRKGTDDNKFRDNWDLIFGKNKDINSTQDNDEGVLDDSQEEKAKEEEGTASS